MDTPTPFRHSNTQTFTFYAEAWKSGEAAEAGEETT